MEERIPGSVGMNPQGATSTVVNEITAPISDMDAAVEAVEDRARLRTIELKEAFDQYKVVDVVHDPIGGSYIVMQEPEVPGAVSMRELGYTSPSPWTSWTREERVSELRDKQGIRKYYDMKRSDGTVRGALRILKTPIQSAEWFVKPASDSSVDKNIAKFVEENLFEQLNISWSRVIEDILLMCEYGYMVMEKVYRQDPDGKIRIQKFGPRHPLDIRDWEYDEHGGPNGLLMDPMPTPARIRDFTTNMLPQHNTVPTEVFLPIEKIMVFVFEEEAGDLRGVSVLRSAFKHWYYKDTLYKIDAIQKERHGIGVPIIKLPTGFKTEDRQLADELGRNLRTNERAHITVPANWEVMFAKLEGQPVDCLPSIKHHDMKIMSNVLAPFLDDSNAKPDSMDMFYKSTRYIASTISDVFNRHCIPELVRMNFSRGKPPKLMIRRIGEWEDIRTMTFALRNLIGAKALTPDVMLEDFLRDQLFLPPQHHESSRELGRTHVESGGEAGGQRQGAPGVAPPGEPRVALPRQQPSPPIGTPQRNAGTDRSGG